MTATTVAALAAAIASLVLLHEVVGPIVGPNERRPPGTVVGDPRDLPLCPRWFARAAFDADLSPADRWWWAAFGLVAGAALLGFALGGVPLLVVVGGGAALSVVGGLRAARHRRERGLAASVPDALDHIARSCRSGSSVVQALHEVGSAGVGPAGEVLAEVAQRVERGAAMRESLDDLVGRHQVGALRLAAAALLVGADTGAAPARAVEGVATTLRDRAALDREAAAHATQAKASAAVLVLAPVGFGVFTIAADPRVGDFLFRSPGGLACLAGGATLDVLGAWWMSRLVGGAR
ncbi:MAG: type II secretion system F family protein [Acidimicrobiia bacterium]|nr:type II secretion system F family protein [Acidimicrobiia bacterium]